MTRCQDGKERRVAISKGLYLEVTLSYRSPNIPFLNKDRRVQILKSVSQAIRNFVVPKIKASDS